MFEANPTRPRVFGVPLGVDFPQALLDGILARLDPERPDAIAKICLITATTRMERRLTDLLRARGPGFLPQLHQVGNLDGLIPLADVPAADDGLATQLELAQMVRALLKTDPGFQAESAAFELADGLIKIIGEIAGEGVDPDLIINSAIAEHHSEYWQKSRAFLELVQGYVAQSGKISTEMRQRLLVEALTVSWTQNPPNHPVLIAGSTGSRGTTRALMALVARLPQGAVILPGVDYDVGPTVWDTLQHAKIREDHPQFCVLDVAQRLGQEPGEIPRWTKDNAPLPARNKLVSLALRPAPVTDSWLSDGPHLKDLDKAVAGLSYLEAPSSRIEALAIALRMRKAAQDGLRVALITPDRVLTRQVTAALQRWQIEPDDSAGVPLSQSPPGRLIRQVARLIGRDLTSSALVALLKHPLVNTADRGEHLRHSRDLELDYLRKACPVPTLAGCQKWAEKRDGSSRMEWVDWIWSCLQPLKNVTTDQFEVMLARHLKAVSDLAAGPGGETSSELWAMQAGEAASATMAALEDASSSGGSVTPTEYQRVVESVLSTQEVRNPIVPHPDIMIWGTLEARVQGADLAILAGLNDSVWPEMPAPDPWLNRDMRLAAGLLLPERRIGLSAHDFQQAIASREVLITRSKRVDGTETVPSRWINRITNLLTGLPQDGRNKLAEMRARGNYWLDLAEQIETPRGASPRAKRPAPCPPVSARPRQLSVTTIEKLVRDPFAIYARYVLGLRPLDQLDVFPDAAMRGTALHEILQAFVETTKEALPGDPEAHLMEIGAQILNQRAPWPATRALWTAKLRRFASPFILSEQDRRRFAKPHRTELRGQLLRSSVGFTLTGTADRVDLTPDGRALIYDYKSGATPTQKVQDKINKQLQLLALMGEVGAFMDSSTLDVEATAYLSLNTADRMKLHSYKPGEIKEIGREFDRLIAAFDTPTQGYMSRRIPEPDRGYGHEYDSLARYGEWEDSDPPVPVDLTRLEARRDP